MNRRIPTIAVAIVIAALQGCAMQQPPVRDPDYAPTMPPTPVSPKDNNGSIYQASSSVGLFEDVKAHRVGDILTIKLVESTNASKSATTTTKKTDSIDTGTPTLLGSTMVRCAEICGTGHHSMRANVYIVPQDSFEAWLAGEMTIEEIVAADNIEPLPLGANQ